MNDFTQMKIKTKSSSKAHEQLSIIRANKEKTIYIKTQVHCKYTSIVVVHFKLILKFFIVDDMINGIFIETRFFSTLIINYI